jgi:hypothetical protein
LVSAALLESLSDRYGAVRAAHPEYLSGCFGAIVEDRTALFRVCLRDKSTQRKIQQSDRFNSYG